MLESLKNFRFNSNQDLYAKFQAVTSDYGTLVIETKGFNMNQIHSVGNTLKSKQYIVSNETKQGFSVEYLSYVDANALSVEVITYFEAEIEANKIVEIQEEL